MTENPYQSDGPPALQQSLVAYADILGYEARSRQALAAGEGETFLRQLHAALTDAHVRMRRSAEGFDPEDRLRPHNFCLQVFTDNIVLGYPCSPLDSGEPELGHMLIILADFQLALAMQGFFVRGGLAFGDHYMDHDVVFGSALLAAVGQDRRGGPPRLSLDQSAVDLVYRHMSFYGGRVEQTPHYEQLLRDADGLFFLDYLGSAFVYSPVGGVPFDVLEAHKRAVVDGLVESRSAPDVRAKFEWLARYHNYVCRRYAESYPPSEGVTGDEDPEYEAIAVEAQLTPEYLVDVESLAASPTPIWFD